MSEKQGKPQKKWFKKLTKVVIPGIFVVVLCGITAIVLIISQSNLGRDTLDKVYTACREDLQNAVQYYKQNNNDSLPILNGSTTVNGSEYPILDVCLLLIPEGGLLREVPEGIWSGNDSNDDNCDSGCEGCHTLNNYIWAVDNNGSVYSTCIGESCIANGEDGYQGVFP